MRVRTSFLDERMIRMILLYNKRKVKFSYSFILIDYPDIPFPLPSPTSCLIFPAPSHFMLWYSLTPLPQCLIFPAISHIPCLIFPAPLSPHVMIFSAPLTPHVWFSLPLPNPMSDNHCFFLLHKYLLEYKNNEL